MINCGDRVPRRHDGGKIIFSTNETISMCKGMKLELYLTAYTKINSTLKRDLKSTTFTREHGGNLLVIGLGNDFWSVTLKLWLQKPK